MNPPFPYFGGKRRVADVVWQALGDVTTYCEPFAGGAAVLLGRPAWHRRGEWHEVLNDIDGHVTNAWRAIQGDPDGVWRHANRMHSEHDLTAWRAELTRGYGSLVERLEADPRWYDVEAAGVWVWGRCVAAERQWNGGGGRQVATLNNGAAASCADGHRWLVDIAERLQGIHVLRGDWQRAVRRADMLRLGRGAIGLFCDPPYGATRDMNCYAHDSADVHRPVSEWCAVVGAERNVRIVLAGYEGEHDALEQLGWRVFIWSTHGGLSVMADSRGRENAERERLWLSPHCLPLDSERQGRLL